MVRAAMPVARAYKTIKDLDKAVDKVENYIALHAKKVKKTQIIIIVDYHIIIGRFYVRKNVPATFVCQH